MSPKLNEAIELIRGLPLPEREQAIQQILKDSSADPPKKSKHRTADVEVTLQQYLKRYHLDAKDDLWKISPRYVLVVDTPGHVPAEGDIPWAKNTSYHYHSKPGVYMMFDEQDLLLYIGKASLSNVLGGRLGSYFKYDANGNCLPTGIWKVPPVYVRTIATEYAYEAPSLEEFLIREHQPPENVRGITRRQS